MLWVTNKRKELVLCYSYEKKVTQIQQAPQNRYIYLQNFNHMPLLESAKFYFSMSKTLVMNTWAVKVPFKQDHTFSAVTSPYRHSAWSLEYWYHLAPVAHFKTLLIFPQILLHESERHAYIPFCHPLKWFDTFRELQIGVWGNVKLLSDMERTPRKTKWIWSAAKQLWEFWWGITFVHGQHQLSLTHCFTRGCTGHRAGFHVNDAVSYKPPKKKDWVGLRGATLERNYLLKTTC